MRMVYSAPILACQVELESKSKKDGSAVNSKPVDKMYQNLQGSKKEILGLQEGEREEGGLRIQNSENNQAKRLKGSNTHNCNL